MVGPESDYSVCPHPFLRSVQDWVWDSGTLRYTQVYAGTLRYSQIYSTILNESSKRLRKV